MQLKHRGVDEKLAWDGSCGLRYVRKRTWRGLLACAPKVDARVWQLSAARAGQRSVSSGIVVSGHRTMVDSSEV